MADSRRRTLAASGQQSMGSSIPVPSSIARPAGSLRQSLAPGMGAGLGGSHAGRQSLAPQRTATNRSSSIGFGSSQTMSSSQESHAVREVPSTVLRNSVYSTHALAGSMSVSRSGTLKTGHELPYAPPSERRSSAYRRSTLGGGGMATTPGRLQLPAAERPRQDPRELKTKAAQARMTAEIGAFLAQRQCPVELKSQSGVFQIIFKFLVQLSDPAVKYPPGTAGGKEWETQFYDSLQVVGYPFPQSFSKSALQSIGSTSTWALFLGLLHWLVNLIENRDVAFDNNLELHIPANLDDGLPRDSDELIQHAWLSYAGSAYPKFLATDDFDENTAKAEVDLFWSRIDDGRREQNNRVEEMKAELEALAKELAEARETKDPLKEWEDKVETTNRDLVKLNKYNKAIADAKERHAKHMEELVKGREALVREEAQLRADLERTKSQVAAQGISQAEIQAMTKDRRQLQENLDQIKKKFKQKLDESLEVEMKLAKEINRATATAANYEAIATRVNILPVPPEGYEHLNFAQEINSAAENPAPDCSQVAKALKELRQAEKAALLKLQQEDIELKQKVDRLNEEIAERAEEDETLAADLAQEENVLASKKADAQDESAKADIQLGQLQRAVTDLSQTLQHPLQQAEWRLQQRTIERAQVAEETTRRRKDNREALTAVLDKLISYKDHVAKQTQLMAEIAGGDE